MRPCDGERIYHRLYAAHNFAENDYGLPSKRGTEGLKAAARNLHIALCLNGASGDALGSVSMLLLAIRRHEDNYGSD
jgi:hypothetical protein